MTITNRAGAGAAFGRVGLQRDPRRRDTAVLLAAFAVLVAVETALFAFAYVPGERAQVVEAWKVRLAAIADDREFALAAWVRERTADAHVVAAYPTVVALAAAGAGAVLPASSGEGTEPHLSGLLDGVVRAYRYQGAYVLDARGAEVARSAGAPPLCEACVTAARGTLAAGTATLDFYLRGDGTAVVAVIAPVLAAAQPGVAPAPVGAVVLTAEPGSWVYPMLLAQPVPTSSGEAVLVRREGDLVRFLSPLRYRNAAPLTYSRPLDTPGLAAQEVVEGHQGYYAYTDYRGAPVFAATRTVAGTPWGLVVKVDRSEALAPFRESARATAIFLGLISAALALAALGFWRSRRAHYEAALARSEARFAHLFEHANDAVVVSRPDGRIVAANPRAGALYGYPRGELLALAIRDLRAPETLPQLGGQLRKVLDGEGLVFETVHLANDGARIPVEVSSRRIEWDGGPVLFSLVRDIRERRAAEERIRFLNRLLRTISEVNQLVVRERDRDRLLAEACRILVEHGEFHMVWVGLTEAGSGRVVPAAIAGFEDGYLTASEIRFDDSPSGRGPTGTAIRERRAVVANDWEADERIAPWRAAGRERGYRASAAVPLETAGAVVGAVTVYADSSGVFTDEVVKLLAELAGDLSFALGAIEVERQKAAAFAALAASEARFRTLFERSPLGYQSLDAEGRLIDVNPAWVEALGYTSDEVAGRWFGDFLAPADVEKFRANFPRFVAAGEIHGIEFEMIRKDGARVVMAFDGRIGRDERGAFKQTHCILADITERKRAEEALRESEERFQTMADSLPQLAWIAKADGFIYWYNRRWFEYTGTTPSQMEGWGWQSVHDPNVLPRVLERWQGSIATGRPFDMEFPLRGADGKFRPFLTRVMPLKDAHGRVIQWFGTNTDISERVAAEEAMRGANERLEVRVQERTAELTDALQAIRSLNADLERRAGELEAANKELEAFSYSVSHDLRAPLRSIDGFSRIVEEEYGGRLDDEGRRLLRVVRDNTRKMAQLIDDLLVFSRSARHPLQPSHIDMGALVRSVYEELTPPEARARCEFTVGALPDAVGDAAMMRQVWANLLSNAAKFSAPASRPAITVSSRVDGGEIVYAVSDNGVGFDMTYAGKLFGVFQRLHPAREFEGTGVGLALVQRIVHRHGGRVWGEGAVGAGATFSFALPAPGGVS